MARRQSADGYVGKEALTIIKLPNGTQAYVYAGQKVPADAPDAEITRLLKEGFIAEAPAPSASSRSRSTRQAADPDAEAAAEAKAKADAEAKAKADAAAAAAK
ncbi:hypothetical protein N8K70_03910 [Microbacterium betulae]|uniref:Uncharacterized protein n=1 Tax=Microbacterium betulae TaxID=2981139 RepID=A0AA97I5K3_9MICO|nr:hypothetical protein [Microbacterium sp. AB]WOF23836.1 hypothetical protein N8K70_03910 [Microbacterium sp. AB]